MRARALRIALLILALGGCGSTEPDSGPSEGGLVITLPQAAILTPSVRNGVASASCALTLEAAQRPRDRSLSWRDLKLVYYRDAELTRPFDSTLVAGRDVALLWTGNFSDPLPPRANLTARATTPFYLTARFRYQVSGRTFEHPIVEVPCLPEIPDQAPTSIQKFSITNADGVIRPPEPLVVDLQLHAPAGGWQGVFRVSSPSCDVSVPFSQPLVATLYQSLVVPLPASCAALDTLSVSLSYSDALNRELREARRVPLVSRDTTPPVIRNLYGDLGPFDAFEGSPIFLDLDGSDNRDLAWLLSEVAPLGERDSIPISGHVLSPSGFTISARRSWVGQNLTLKYWLRDAVGLESNVLQSPVGAIRVYPTVPAPVITRQIGGGIGQVLLDPKRERLYVLQLGQELLSVLSSTTLQTIADLPSHGMRAMDFSPSGDSLVLVGLNYRLGILNLNGTASIDTFSFVPASGYPDASSSLFMLANGKAYVSTDEGGAAAEIDLTSRQSRVLGQPLLFLARSGDHRRAVVTDGNNVRRFRSETAALDLSRTMYWSLHTQMNSDGSLIAVGGALLDDNLVLKGTLFGEIQQWGLYNTPVALSADGSTIVNSDSRSSLVRVDPLTRRPISRSSIGVTWPEPSRILLSPDGKQAVIYQTDTASPSRLAVMTLP